MSWSEQVMVIVCFPKFIDLPSALLILCCKIWRWHSNVNELNLCWNWALLSKYIIDYCFIRHVFPFQSEINDIILVNMPASITAFLERLLFILSVVVVVSKKTLRHCWCETLTKIYDWFFPKILHLQVKIN